MMKLTDGSMEELYESEVDSMPVEKQSDTMNINRWFVFKADRFGYA